MFVAASNGAPYHVNLVVPSLTVVGSGSYECPPNGCPANSYHTLYAMTSFGGAGGAHGTAGAKGEAQGYPASQLNAVANEVGINCDPFFGDPEDGNPSCNPYYNGQAICSVMGLLTSVGSTGIPIPFFGTASTLVKNLSGSAGYNCQDHLFGTECEWNTAPNCANTSSPVWSPPSIYDSPPGLAGWWSLAKCVRAGTSQPWLCFAIPLMAYKTTQTTPGNCTGP